MTENSDKILRRSAETDDETAISRPWMYVTEDGRPAVIYWLENPPLTAWIGFPDVWLAVPAWLLTPHVYARIWVKFGRVEDKLARDNLLDSESAKLLRDRWQQIDEYASEYLDQGELFAAKQIAQSGGKLPPLPRPGPRPYTPFDWVIECHGNIAKWRKIDCENVPDIPSSCEQKPTESTTMKKTKTRKRR